MFMRSKDFKKSSCKKQS